MLLVISPAKTLDYESPLPTTSHSVPDYLDDSALLIEQLRLLSPQDVSSLMHISDKLGSLNFGRYQDWQLPFTPANARQAVLAFKGDVYTGLQAATMSKADLQWAQQHLRILSGLYGLLRPLDLMQPYRLEMGTKFANNRGANLYQFWGDKITEKLNDALKKDKSPTLINLASNEYFKAAKAKKIEADIITPVFKDLKNDKYKVISFFAKKARGLMARFVIENRLKNPQQLKQFDSEGYVFNPSLSSASEWVFCRDTT